MPRLDDERTKIGGVMLNERYAHFVTGVAGIHQFSQVDLSGIVGLRVNHDPSAQVADFGVT